MIFTIPWENSITIGNLGTLTRFIGYLLVGFWALTVLIEGEVRKFRPFHLFVFLFILWNLISIFWSYSLGESLQRLKTYILLFGLVIVLWNIYSSREALKSGLQAYILGAYVAIGSTINNYLSGRSFSEFSYRYTGADLNANDLALILAIGIPIAWHLAVSAGSDTKNQVLRFLNLVYLPASVFVILLTATRTAVFAIAPALLFIFITIPRLRIYSQVILFICVISIILIIQPYIPQSSLERIASIGPSIATGDLGGRLALWREAIAEFSMHPLLGVGSGAFRTISEYGGAVHNSFLSVLAELGIIGFALFIAIIAIVSYQAFQQPSSYSKLWLAVLTVWVIGVSTLTWESRKPTWFIFSLVIIAANLYKHSSQEELYPGISAQAGSISSFRNM